VFDNVPQCNDLLRFQLRQDGSRVIALDSIHSDDFPQVAAASLIHLNGLDLETRLFREMREQTLPSANVKKATRGGELPNELNAVELPMCNTIQPLDRQRDGVILVGIILV